MKRHVLTRYRRAFTIWELLCVLFVIFLLVGLLMPSLSKVRQKSTRMVCGSYLVEYGKVGQMYLNDNDGTFPLPTEWLYRTESGSQSHPIGCRWHDRAMSPQGRIMTASSENRGVMWSYVSDRRTCPTFRRFARSRGCENINHNRKLDIDPQSSYTMNGYLGSTRFGGVLKRAQVRSPGEVFFFAEENPWSVRPDHPKHRARWLSAALSTSALEDTALLVTPTPQAENCFATYHDAPRGDLNRGSGHVVFVDGHADRISAEDQLRKKMHGGDSSLGPAGNLSWAWASELSPPGGWDAQ